MSIEAKRIEELIGAGVTVTLEPGSALAEALSERREVLGELAEERSREAQHETARKDHAARLKERDDGWR